MISIVPATVPCVNMPFCTADKSTATGLELGPAGIEKQMEVLPVENSTAGFEKGFGRLEAFGVKLNTNMATKSAAVVGLDDVTFKVGCSVGDVGSEVRPTVRVGTD